jgi:hypothetical protein
VEVNTDVDRKTITHAGLGRIQLADGRLQFVNAVKNVWVSRKREKLYQPVPMIALILEAANTSETSVDCRLYGATTQNTNLRIYRRENLKSQVTRKCPLETYYMQPI